MCTFSLLSIRSSRKIVLCSLFFKYPKNVKTSFVFSVHISHCSILVKLHLSIFNNINAILGRREHCPDTTLIMHSPQVAHSNGLTVKIKIPITRRGKKGLWLTDLPAPHASNGTSTQQRFDPWLRVLTVAVSTCILLCQHRASSIASLLWPLDDGRRPRATRHDTAASLIA